MTGLASQVGPANPWRAAAAAVVAVVCWGADELGDRFAASPRTPVDHHLPRLEGQRRRG